MIADTFDTADSNINSLIPVQSGMSFAELRQHLGVISISEELLVDDWPGVVGALRGAIVMRAEDRLLSRTIEYTILAPGLLKVPNGEEAVRYWLRRASDGELRIGTSPDPDAAHFEFVDCSADD